jgi:hypothetical protein
MRELGRKKAARNGLLEEVVRAPRSAGPKNPLHDLPAKKTRVATR